MKDNPYQLHLKITEILESSSLFLDNSETKLDSSLGSPELSKSEASLANSFTLGGELVVSSREQGANFHVHLNQQQQQQQPLPQSLSQSSASEVSTRSSPASPNSTISLAPQILRIPSRPFQQQTRQNLLRQSDLPLHYPISGKTSGPNASNITGSIASTISGSRKSSISVDISPPPLLPVFPTSGPTLPTLLPEPLPRNDFDFAPKFSLHLVGNQIWHLEPQLFMMLMNPW